MTNFRVTYRGPSTFAVRAAALLADTDGVELTSATRADEAEASDGTVLLVLTVEATADAVSAALAAVRAELPADAIVFGEEPVGG